MLIIIESDDDDYENIYKINLRNLRKLRIYANINIRLIWLREIGLNANMIISFL